MPPMVGWYLCVYAPPGYGGWYSLLVYAPSLLPGIPRCTPDPAVACRTVSRNRGTGASTSTCRTEC